MSSRVALVVLAFALAQNAFAGTPVPEKPKAQSSAANTVCEVNGKKGYRAAGSQTCIVISGYVSVTAGGKVH